MDLKANFIREHYKKLIENREFDEFDILGFLIFIRSFIKPNKQYPLIEEFLLLFEFVFRNLKVEKIRRS